MGLKVPEDVALVGFDDVVQPGVEENELTSMAQNFDGIGHTATEMVLDRIANPGRSPRSHSFPANLVVRLSSSSPKAADEMLDAVRFNTGDAALVSIVKKKTPVSV